LQLSFYFFAKSVFFSLFRPFGLNFPSLLRQRRAGQASGTAPKGPTAQVLQAIFSFLRRSMR